MRKLICSLLLAFCLAAPSGLFATEYTLTDTTYFTKDGTNAAEDLIAYGWGDVNRLDGCLDFVIWKHQYSFDPQPGELLSATLAVSLLDDEKDVCGLPWTWELGAGAAESWQFAFGEVDTGTYAYDIDVDYLSDGKFIVGIKSCGGDFSIKESVLTINYSTAPVPEPATLMLLGGGLLALAGFRKKKHQ